MNAQSAHDYVTKYSVVHYLLLLERALERASAGLERFTVFVDLAWVSKNFLFRFQPCSLSYQGDRGGIMMGKKDGGGERFFREGVGRVRERSVFGEL